MRKRWSRAAFPLVASLLVAAAGIGAYVHHARRQAREERPRLASLQAFDLETFTKTFNAGAGDARVLAMLSPT
jgi:hypothetical protein